MRITFYLVLGQSTALWTLLGSCFKVASDRAKWGNYVHSYMSGSQGVNITLFFFSVVIVVYVVSVSVVFFFWGGRGVMLCFCCCCCSVVFCFSWFFLFFLFFCSNLCSFFATIVVSVIDSRKYLLLEQHFNNL